MLSFLKGFLLYNKTDKIVKFEKNCKLAIFPKFHEIAKLFMDRKIANKSSF